LHDSQDPVHIKIDAVSPASVLHRTEATGALDHTLCVVGGAMLARTRCSIGRANSASKRDSMRQLWIITGITPLKLYTLYPPAAESSGRCCPPYRGGRGSWHRTFQRQDVGI